MYCILVAEMYGKSEGIPATFQIIYMIGWKPDPKQVVWKFSFECVNFQGGKVFKNLKFSHVRLNTKKLLILTVNTESELCKVGYRHNGYLQFENINTTYEV